MLLEILFFSSALRGLHNVSRWVALLTRKKDIFSEMSYWLGNEISDSAQYDGRLGNLFSDILTFSEKLVANGWLFGTDFLFWIGSLNWEICSNEIPLPKPRPFIEKVLKWSDRSNSVLSCRYDIIKIAHYLRHYSRN